MSTHFLSYSLHRFFIDHQLSLWHICRRKCHPPAWNCFELFVDYFSFERPSGYFAFMRWFSTSSDMIAEETDSSNEFHSATFTGAVRQVLIRGRYIVSSQGLRGLDFCILELSLRGRWVVKVQEVLISAYLIELFIRSWLPLVKIDDESPKNIVLSITIACVPLLISL